MDTTLSEKINHLRQKISEIDALPPSQRDQLLESLNELEAAAPEDAHEQLPLIKQFEESLIEAEAKHPDAAQMLRGLGDSLGRMGL